MTMKFKDLNKLAREFNNKVIKFKTTKHKGKKPKIYRGKEHYEFKYGEMENEDNE